MDERELEEALIVRVRTENATNPHQLRSEVAVLKNGPRAYKVASVRYFGPPDSDEVKKRELRCRTYHRHVVPGLGYDFDAPTQEWHCEDAEIEALRTFLNAELGPSGEYDVIDRRSRTGAVVQAIQSGEVDVGGLVDVLSALIHNENLLAALKGSQVAELLTSAVEVHRHRSVIRDLTTLVEAGGTSEQMLQHVLDDEWWIFGGRYIQKLDRRQFNALDQVDFALVRADGGAHIIELKRADVEKVVIHHRNHYSIGPDVSIAVSQAMNYLSEFDRQEDYLARTFGIDCRRVHATVIIGHPHHNNVEGIGDESFHQTIRSYNSHLSRVEVISYADLVASARNDVESLASRVEQAEEPAGDRPPLPDEPPLEEGDERRGWWSSQLPDPDDVPF